MQKPKENYKLQGGRKIEGIICCGNDTSDRNSRGSMGQ